jgi:hypothetical protein
MPPKRKPKNEEESTKEINANHEHENLLKKQKTEILNQPTDEDNSASEEEEDIPTCVYGEKCYRKNPQHFKEFRHPHLDSQGKPKKKAQSKEIESKKEPNDSEPDKKPKILANPVKLAEEHSTNKVTFILDIIFFIQ